MTRKIDMSRLGIALVSVVVATAGLSAPKAYARAAVGTPVFIETASKKQAVIRVQRPPRLPRTHLAPRTAPECLTAGSEE